MLFLAAGGQCSAALLVDVSASAGEPSLRREFCVPYQTPACYTYSEPSIAVSPIENRTIAIVAFAGAWGPGIHAPIFKSSDGGVTWRRVPQIPKPPGGDITGPGDQKIAFDSAGKLLLAELGYDEGGTTDRSYRDYIYRQIGGPDEPLQPGEPYGDDQPHITVDTSFGTACAGTVYSPWLDATLDRSNAVSSVDRGATVSNKIVGDPDEFANRTTRVAVAKSGQAFVVYKTREGGIAGSKYENAHYYVKRSDDCGKSWNALGPTGVSVTGKRQAKTYFTDFFGNESKGMVTACRSSDVWITTGPAGDVYVAYINADTSGFSQLYVARSTDGGATWTSSRVTDGRYNAGFPEVAVTANGTIGVLYVDFDDSGTETVFAHKFARLRAASPVWNVDLLQQLVPSRYINAKDGHIWGDFEGLVSAGNTFMGVFTGESIGRLAPQLAPIFFTEEG